LAEAILLIFLKSALKQQQLLKNFFRIILKFHIQTMNNLTLHSAEQPMKRISKLWSTKCSKWF